MNLLLAFSLAAAAPAASLLQQYSSPSNDYNLTFDAGGLDIYRARQRGAGTIRYASTAKREGQEAGMADLYEGEVD